jgi:hypothetical protein
MVRAFVRCPAPQSASLTGTIAGARALDPCARRDCSPLGRDGGVEGIVRVVTCFEANDTAYSVMELLSGETLDTPIMDASYPEGISSATTNGYRRKSS